MSGTVACTIPAVDIRGLTSHGGFHALREHEVREALQPPR